MTVLWESKEVNINTGDIITMKKKHPCGSSAWKILRTGADFRLECTGCGRQVMLPRPQVEKNIKKIVRDGEEVCPFH